MPSASTTPAFDRAAVLAYYGGDAGLLRQLAAVCVAEWPRNVARLQAAVAAADADALRAAAHRMKGGFAHYLAESAVAAARRLEAACAGGLPADHLALLEEVLRRGEEVVAELRREAARV